MNVAKAEKTNSMAIWLNPKLPCVLTVTIKEAVIIEKNFREEKDYIVGICNNGLEFKFDKEDYKHLKGHKFRVEKRNANIVLAGKRDISLKRFILECNGINTEFKICHKNKDSLDLRKSNLYYDNIYRLINNEYYEVECFCGGKFLIDKDDYEKISKHKWHIVNGYVVGKVNKIELRLHRYLLGLNKMDNIETDHINRNGLDNRRSNLRTCNRFENMRNIDNRNPIYKGVYRQTQGYGWVASISHYGKKYYLGCYKDVEDAIRVRKEAEQRLFGEFNYSRDI